MMWVLVLAAVLDFVIGDPWSWIHPVQVMGWFISRYSQFVLANVKNPSWQKLAGMLLTFLLVSGSMMAVGMVKWLHPGIGLAIEGVILASCFAGKSLRDAAEDVLEPLQQEDLQAARSRLSRYVGRDTADLSKSEILRAVVETVAENGVDGVMAPLFWAIVGCFTPIGPAPLAMGYKAVSTLDSMVGYIAPPYTHLGWFSAKLDDVLTYLPCRLMVLSLGIISRHPIQLWQQCDRDGRQDPSPNSGWSECAYAVTLGIQLGGFNTYRGIAKPKPLLGLPHNTITTTTVRSALTLNRRCFLSWLFIAIGLLCLRSETFLLN